MSIQTILLHYYMTRYINVYFVWAYKMYFCFSHLTRTTQWEDPRKSLAAQAANQHQRSAEQLLSPGNDSGSSTNATSTPTNSPPHIHSTLQGERAHICIMYARALLIREFLNLII